uniref:PRESAN domain-containing protein n=1 Tax=Schistosoma mansoni TaxID=6183 RepID=A0A3Q0KQ93_SCHMA
MLINSLVNYQYYYYYYYYYTIIIYATKHFKYLIIKKLTNYLNKLIYTTELNQIIKRFNLSWTIHSLNQSMKRIRVNFKNLSLKSNDTTYFKCNQMNPYNHNILKNPFIHNITDCYIKATKKKHNLLLYKTIQIIMITILFNYSIVYMNKNLCIDAMHLHHTILSPLSERSINSETMFESDSSTIPTYFINSPVVKLLKTSKNKQQTYLDNGLQLENKVMQRISSIFQDKKAIQDLLREMNAYYLTYGRPRYG